MAGQLLNVTRSITTLTFSPGATADTWQDGKDALDVLGYAGTRFDFSLKVFSFAGTSATVKLYTSMYNDDNNSTWNEIATFTVTAGNVVAVASANSGVLRYIRWHIAYTSVTLVSFEVLGVAW
jgi:hypothetical protein